MTSRGSSFTTVPSGYAVTTHHPSRDPCVVTGSGGLLIAQLGYVGDDYELVSELCEQVGAALRQVPCRAEVVAAAQSLSQLLAPSAVPRVPVDGGIVWSTWEDGLSAMLNDPSGFKRFEQLLLKFSGHPQWLVLNTSWPGSADSLAALNASGIRVVRSIPSSPFLVEVKQPTGEWLSAFSTEAMPPPAGVGSQPQRLFRAPRLRRLLLAQSAQTDATIRALLSELSERRHPFLFFANADRVAMMMQWANHAALILPVYPDAETVQHLLINMKESERASVGAVPIEPHQLWEWALDAGFLVALGVCNANGHAGYRLLDEGDLRFLLGHSARNSVS